MPNVRPPSAFNTGSAAFTFDLATLRPNFHRGPKRYEVCIGVKATFTAGTGSLDFTVDVSRDGTNWFATRFISVQTTSWDMVSTVSVTADTTGKELLRIPICNWPYCRLTITNSGGTNATALLVEACIAEVS